MKLITRTLSYGNRVALFGFFCLGVSNVFAQEITYNTPGSTNYIGSTTNGVLLLVGDDEPDVTLFVTNGGMVEVQEVFVGAQSQSKNNLLSVDPGGVILAGNVDTNNLTTGGIVVGDVEGKGLMALNYSSEVETDYLYVGLGTNETGKVAIMGDGRLSIGEQLVVGSSANTNNLLEISGGEVFVNETTDITINNISGATNGFNRIEINSSGKLLIGGDVNSTSFTSISNLNFNAGAILGVGGALSTDDGTIENALNILLDNNLSTNASGWDAGTMSIGKLTDNNSLTVTNGAQATATGSIYIGREESSSGNSVNIGGTNSALQVSGKAFVGANGDNNKLNITKGGHVVIAQDLKIGSSRGSDNNSVTISDEGSTLVVSNNFILGSSGIKNRYTQTGGTNTVAGEFIIGETEDASGKTSGIDTTGNLGSVGEGTFLGIQQGLTVGKEGNGSVLLVGEGAIVNVTGDAIIGEASDDNFIFLQDDAADNRFNVTGDLIVGKEGGLNRFAVYSGVANIGENVYVGNSTNHHERENYIHLQTTNAVLNVANAIHIGASNSVNTLTLAAGAKASAQDLFVGAYEGTSNNVVTISGEDNDLQQGWFGYVTNSTLSISNQLVIGSNSGSNNAVILRKGGILYVQQDKIEIGAGTNNTLEVRDGGTLRTLDWDFADMTGTATNILFQAGSTLELGGLLSGTNMVEDGIGFTLNGTNALWDTGTDVLYVGNETSENSLTITNGATATTSTNLYIGYLSENNTVTVGGTGSVLNVGHDLFIGNVNTNDSGFNNLFVFDGGLVSVGNNLENVHGGTLKIDSRSQVTVTGDYEQDKFSTLSVGISSNATPPNLEVVGNAELEVDTNIEVYDDGIGDNTNVVQTIVKAGTLTIGGKTASTGLLWNNININIHTNLLLEFRITVSNSTANSFIVLDNFIKRSIKEAAGLEGMLADVADEIDGMASAGNTNATKMRLILDGLDGGEANKAMNDYYGEKASSAPMHNVINQGIGSIASELTVRGDNTRSRMATAPAPAGAAGPHTQGQELQGWIAGYGTWGDKSDSDGFDAYDSSLSGFIIGADLAVSRNILVGLAGGSNGGSVDKDNGASGDTKTTYGAVYASLGTTDWFLDGSVIYGSSSIDNELGDVFDTTADYDAMNLAFYLGGGKEIIGKYLIITPQASLLANYYEQDAYDETSSDAVARSVDSFDALYVQSSIGCNLGIYMTMGDITLKPELRAHWLHEFNASEEDLAYTLIGGTGGNYNMLLQAPEEDVLRIGAGVSAKLSEYLELRADFDTQQASTYSDYTVSGSLRYQF